MIELEPSLFIVRDELLVLGSEAQVSQVASRPDLTPITVSNLDAFQDTFGRFVVERGSSLQTIRDEVAALFPSAAVDYNHGFQLAQSQVHEAITANLYRAQPLDAIAELRVGMIDGLVSATHPTLTNAKIKQIDFTGSASSEPSDHGTAVASLLVGEADSFVGLAVGAELFAAAVFVDGPESKSIAVTDALVHSLAWLAQQRVDVVNLSLAGPPNALLERAIQRLNDNATTLIAAVGNEGPFSSPRYPAAYPGVIGVGAIDSEGRIYRRSGRGDHVEFTAPGVAVLAASSDGTLRPFTGTSFAAPIVSGLLLQQLSQSPTRDRALEVLRTDTLDLGKPGVDSVFGRGVAGRSLMNRPLTP